MDWLSDVLSSDKNIDDKDICLQVMEGYKAHITTVCNAMFSIENPELRGMAVSELISSANEYYNLLDYTIQNKWNNPNLLPQDIVKKDLKEVYKLSLKNEQ